MIAKDLVNMRKIAQMGKITYSGHALDRLFERGISIDDVENVLKSSTNQLIEVQPPSSEPGKSHKDERWLIYDENIAIEVIVVIVFETGGLPELHVVTAERPDADKWDKRTGQNPVLVRKKT